MPKCAGFLRGRGTARDEGGFRPLQQLKVSIPTSTRRLRLMTDRLIEARWLGGRNSTDVLAYEGSSP